MNQISNQKPVLKKFSAGFFTQILQNNDSRFYIDNIFLSPKGDKENMSRLWNWINSREFSDEGKVRVFLFLTCAVSGVIGYAVWLILKDINFNSFESALCFVGYPALIVGYLGGFIFLCKNKEERR